MGHGSSKSSSSDDSTNGGGSNSKSLPSRRERIKEKLHLHRHRDRPAGSSSGSHSQHSKLSRSEDFAGIALLTLNSAEMKFKDKWFACVSIGEQTFRTETSDQLSQSLGKMRLSNVANDDHVQEAIRLFNSSTMDAAKSGINQHINLTTEMASEIKQAERQIKRRIGIGGYLSERRLIDDLTRTGLNESIDGKYFLLTNKPTWNSEKKFLLERNGPHVAKISVIETNRLSKNNLIGYCEVDLFEFLSRVSDSDSEVFDLLDPSSSNVVVGNISLSCSVEDPIETEKSFARRILSIVDYNGDGNLSFSEFSELINAFGNQQAAKKKEELFKAADENGDGVVSMDELATLLAAQQEKEPLINRCPVCGELLEVSDNLNSMIHMSLCFDEGTGKQVMTGGFLTDKQASYGWMFKLTEWAHVSSYDAGLNSGSSASHIVVFDRRKKRLIEEIIDGKIVLSMRAIYQSKVGLGIMDKGAKELLQSISEKQGKKMNSVESAKDIPTFLKFFKDQINMAEVKYPLDHFKTFNEFFIRELKPGARPIACVGRDDVAVCAADCRLMAFRTAEESLRFWIKGKKFSIRGLLGNIPCSNTFIGGTLVIFRLAPQDYHRFHFPVSGKIEQIVDIPGCLYTVNPIAVNSKYCNVFTENKRAVSIISTADFGKVAFVAIGATMVGSITFTKKKGDYVQKGDEFGYFSFGGSTVICVFEKESIAVDEDLLAYSARSIETLVCVGMQLGVSVKKRAELPLPDIKNCALGV